MRRWRIEFAAGTGLRRAGVAVLGALAAAGCGSSDLPAAPARPPATVVAVAAAVEDVPLYLDEIGRCVPSEAVTVVAQVTGKVTAISFADGADLRAKAPLFTIDPRPYEARLAQARARAASQASAVTQAKAARDTSVARVAGAKSRREEARARGVAGKATAEAVRGDTAAAEADRSRAADDLKRVEALAASQVASEQELSRARTEATAAEARLAAARRREAAAAAQATESAAAESSAEEGIHEAEAQRAEADAKVASAEAEAKEAEAAVEPARIDAENCEVAAPIAGRAGRRLVDVGNVVAANVTPLLSIQRVNPIHVEFTVTEDDLSAVQKRLGLRPLTAEVRLPGEDETRQGEVAFLDNAVSERTGTTNLYARLANEDARFWPGRFVRVRLLLETIPGAILVPAGAPQTSPRGPFVYVVAAGKDGPVAEMRPVRLGQRHGDRILVQSGLAAGDRVIVEGQGGVWTGERVEEAPAAPAEVRSLNSSLTPRSDSLPRMAFTSQTSRPPAAALPSGFPGATRRSPRSAPG